MIIYKYDITRKRSIDLPVGAQVLSVAEQRGNIVLYAMVPETVESVELYDIIIVGTGHPVGTILDGSTFLGTVSLQAGIYMFHIFYRRA